MDFFIQVSNPKINQVDIGGLSLSDAIEDIFPMNTEYLILSWKYFRIPLNYKYDVSIVIRDILIIIEKILKDKTGNIDRTFPSNTFFADWQLEWDEENITVSSKWHSVIGGIENELNNSGSIALSKLDFLGEWNSLLIMLISSLKTTGYEGEEFDKAIFLSNMINREGILYR